MKAEEKRLTMRDDMMGYDDDEGAGQGQAGSEIIDEEELALIQRMKDLKRTYRMSYDQLKEIKSQVFYISQTIDSLKQSLVSAYEDWYSLNFDEDDLQSTLVSFQCLIHLK